MPSECLLVGLLQIFSNDEPGYSQASAVLEDCRQIQGPVAMGRNARQGGLGGHARGSEGGS